MDYGGVVGYEDGFNGEGWDLCDHDTPEGIGDRGVYADEGERGFEGFVFVDFDLEFLFKFVLVPGMILS